MIFFNPAIDTPLQQELLQHQVCSQANFTSMKMPSEGRLMDVVVEHAERIDSGKWISWLIQKHGCIRFHEPSVDDNWVASLDFSSEDTRLMRELDVFPLERWRNAVLVGIARPQAERMLEVVKASAGCTDVFGVALSPIDVRRLRETFVAYRLFI